MIWTNDMDSVLTAGWHGSLPTPQIAALIGAGVSASAVRGRARDLQLPMRGQLEAYWSGKHQTPHGGGPPRCKMPDLNQPAPGSRPMLLVEREFGECVWPLCETDDGFLVCGADCPPGARRQYCLFHLALTIEAADAA